MPSKRLASEELLVERFVSCFDKLGDEMVDRLHQLPTTRR
jgi:hypothetical protein